MKSFTLTSRIVVAMLVLTVLFVQTAKASLKAGEVEVYEGKTATITLAEPYQRTLRMSTVLSYKWSSANSSYVSLMGSTQNYTRIKGMQATSSCKVYFQCTYSIDGYLRTMDFYYTVTVKPTSVDVTHIALNRSAAELSVGETLQLTAIAYPTNATNRTVSWSSNNPMVATVSSNGRVTAQMGGTATITARSSNGKTATCAITCKATIPTLVFSDKEGLATIPAVANVRYERTFQAGWNSVCLPFAFDAELLGLKEAKIALLGELEVVGNTPYLSYQLVQRVEAGKACLVYVPTAQTVNVSLQAVELANQPDNNGNLSGTFTSLTIGSGCYKLAADGKSFAVTKTSSAVCKPFRAYIGKK